MPVAAGTERFRLNRVLREMGILRDESDDQIHWTSLVGGYHNDVSLVSTAAGKVVVKHFVAGSSNPRYPQLPADEFQTLQALAGTGLAPEPLGLRADVDGRPLLVYAYVPGEMWSADTAPTSDVGAMLRRLHDQSIVDGFRELPSDPAPARERSSTPTADRGTSSSAKTVRV